MRSLIDQHVREEIMYREALAMGLEQDDAIVRRRLAQKLAFLSEDLTPVPAPQEAALGRFFEQNRDVYRKTEHVSFTHIYFSPDRRGDHAGGDARYALAVLRSGNPGAEASTFGDPFMLMHTYAQRSEQEIADLFGHDFASAVMALPVGVWQGPVPSGYGLHLVRVSSQTAARNPSLDEVRTQVAEDFNQDQRRKANDAFYERLKDRYQVVIQVPDTSPAVKGG